MSEPTKMWLVGSEDGALRCIYDEALDLRALRRTQIAMARHMEQDFA